MVTHIKTLFKYSSPKVSLFTNCFSFSLPQTPKSRTPAVFDNSTVSLDYKHHSGGEKSSELNRNEQLFVQYVTWIISFAIWNGSQNFSFLPSCFLEKKAAVWRDLVQGCTAYQWWKWWWDWLIPVFTMQTMRQKWSLWHSWFPEYGIIVMSPTLDFL